MVTPNDSRVNLTQVLSSVHRETFLGQLHDFGYKGKKWDPQALADLPSEELYGIDTDRVVLESNQVNLTHRLYGATALRVESFRTPVDWIELNPQTYGKDRPYERSMQARVSSVNAPAKLILAKLIDDPGSQFKSAHIFSTPDSPPYALYTDDLIDAAEMLSSPAMDLGLANAVREVRGDSALEFLPEDTCRGIIRAIRWSNPHFESVPTP